MELKTLKEKRIIAVIGESQASSETMNMAMEVGSLIAERGGILICGGLGGVMSAASEGAKRAGGLTIGILPVYDRDAANEYIDIVIPTGLGHARNAIIAAAAEGVIAVGGSYGTLSEIALARKMAKPVMTLSSFEIYRDGKLKGDILTADTPRHAVSRLWKVLETGSQAAVDN